MKVNKSEKNTGDVHVFRLYITGASPNSSKALTNIKIILEKYLEGKYELEVIDVYQQPIIARNENIIALPLLIRKFPLPEVRLIGDLSDNKKVLEEMGLPMSA